MKYLAEFRDGALARTLAAKIAAAALPGRDYRLMEFCGGHTHAIARYGVPALLPSQVRLVHGPGCPVCVLPVGRVDMAIELVLRHGVTLCSYGDVLRVPASDGLSLLKARARGGDVRMVYSVDDALVVARAEPRRQVVFFAIGFETTTPPTAVALLRAQAEGLTNFSVLCCHVLTPPAIEHILAAGEVPLAGFLGPAHVSTVIGSDAFAPFVARHGKPVVIAGFEPLDVMQAILMLIRQINDGRAVVENEYTRAVSPAGNRKAQDLMARVFTLRDPFEWRGLGLLPASALALRDQFAAFDAERRFAIGYRPAQDHQGCACGAILRGLAEPRDCRLFGTACTPSHPLGACMVSSEGACAAVYAYGQHKGAGR